MPGSSFGGGLQEEFPFARRAAHLPNQPAGLAGRQEQPPDNLPPDFRRKLQEWEKRKDRGNIKVLRS